VVEREGGNFGDECPPNCVAKALTIAPHAFDQKFFSLLHLILILLPAI